MTCDTLVVGTGAGCHAAFIAMPDSINSSSQYLFFDQSSGNITTWLWNFGDPGSGTNNTSTAQNPTHIFNTPGSYNVCLTIHGSDSTCYDITCQTIVIGGGSGCQANFSYLANPAPDNHTISFTDLSTGPPTAWFWNFGDGTSSNLQNPVHTFTGPALVHTVCLTITGNNCTSTFCQNVVIQDSVTYHQVYGQVFAGNFPISLGLAMIFSLDTNTNYQPFVAVCPIDSNGVYYFTQVPDGNYYIMAIPMDSNGYLPTYYGNTISWEQATIVALGTANNPYNINLVASDQMTSGPGSASGQINMGDLPTSMLDKINMILMNEQGKAIGFTKVSSSGAFDFPSLAYGVYYMHPEMPGITSDNIKVTLTAEKPHSDVVMTFNGKSILGIRDVVSFVNRWSVYPNPVVDHITISLDLKKGIKAEVSIYNMTGQLVESREVNLNDGANSIGIPTASLPEGIYSLRVYSKEGLIISTKVVKTR
jgi:PKD repeat protein